MTIVDSLQGGLQDLVDWAKSSFQIGSDKVVEVLETLDAAAPQLREIGYEVTEIRLTLGLVPSVTIRVERFKVVDEPGFDRFFDRHADQPMLCQFVGLLQRTAEIQDRMAMKNRNYDEMEIELGMPPTVHIISMPSPRSPISRLLRRLGIEPRRGWR